MIQDILERSTTPIEQYLGRLFTEILTGSENEVSVRPSYEKGRIVITIFEGKRRVCLDINESELYYERKPLSRAERDAHEMSQHLKHEKRKDFMPTQEGIHEQ